MSSFLSKPLVTPSTRFATWARAVPYNARARLVSTRGATLTAPFSNFTSTSSCTTNCSWPFGPFILTVCPSTVAVTPDGTVTGLLPIRDMVDLSEHRKENFAAHIRVARVVVSHDSLGCRQNGNAETIVDPRQVLDRGVNPSPGLRDPLDFADDRLAIEIFQLDLELAAS